MPRFVRLNSERREIYQQRCRCKLLTAAAKPAPICWVTVAVCSLTPHYIIQPRENGINNQTDLRDAANLLLGFFHFKSLRVGRSAANVNGRASLRVRLRINTAHAILCLVFVSLCALLSFMNVRAGTRTNNIRTTKIKKEKRRVIPVFSTAPGFNLIDWKDYYLFV